MYEIIPGILEKNWEDIEKKILLLSPFAKTLHIDVIDGIFAPNRTFMDPAPFSKYKDQFFLEAHFMVKEPINYLKSFADAGFKRMIGHVEKMSDQIAFVARGQTLGEIGLALDGPTQIADIRVPLDDVDCIHVYTSHKVGFSGPPLLPERLRRITQIRELSRRIPIEVDGGIKDTTIKSAKIAGATRFVATSFISEAPDPEAAFIRLQKLITDS